MSNNFFQNPCRLWDNMEKYGTARQATDDNTIWRMRFACWISKATDTLSEYVILIGFPRQQWLRKRASMLRYTCIDSLVHYTSEWLDVALFKRFHTVTAAPTCILHDSRNPSWHSAQARNFSSRTYNVIRNALTALIWTKLLVR
jgi:hypothetical protein